MQTITVKVELLKPTEVKKKMYKQMTETNTKFANWLLSYSDLNDATSKVFKLFSSEKFPSAVANQTIREVKSQKKNQKAKQFKRLWCKFNNQNSIIEKEKDIYTISFPTLEKRIGVPLVVHDRQKVWVDKILDGSAKKGAVMLHEKRGRWYVSITLSFKPKIKPSLKVKIMGIDVGFRYPAVASIGTKSLFFDGKMAGFIRRKFNSSRKILGKMKKLNAIKKSKDKESRWITDFNHKISRSIINEAMRNGVSLIRMEDLTGIRHSAKSSKRADRSLHNWAHFELQSFIEYKAQMAGIEVEYVKPEFTFQTCKCGHKEKSNRRQDLFKCRKCGYISHADLNASINIGKAISGISTTKKCA